MVLLRFEFVSVLAESDILFKTNSLQPLVVNEVNKLDDTIAQHHTLFFIILRQFMLVILSTDLTISRLGLSDLLVVMSKYDLDVNIQASDSRDKFFMKRCVCAVLQQATPTGAQLTTAGRQSQSYTMGSPRNEHN